MIKLLKPEYLLYSLLTPLGVWVGAKMTWVHQIYYGPSLLSIAVFLSFLGSLIIFEIIENKSSLGTSGNLQGRYAVKISTALIIAFILLVISVIIAISINYYILISLVSISVLILLSAVVNKKATLLKYLILPLIGGIVVLSGGLAVEPKFTFAFPGPIIPALFTMIFIINIEITTDIKNIVKESQDNVKTLPDIIGIPKSLIMIILFFIVFVLITLIAVLNGWLGLTFKIITIYIIDLPTLVLLILIWGNPNVKMLSIGSAAFKIGWILSMAALIVN